MWKVIRVVVRRNDRRPWKNTDHVPNLNGLAGSHGVYISQLIRLIRALLTGKAATAKVVYNYTN